ncbi:MAG TPA: tetratricopeptide repeat protein [Thermoplasmata archaeon]|nr:tetratricopeptide repeat protein [Thermoplasmata archaeon]
MTTNKKVDELIHEGNSYLNELEFEKALKCFKEAIKLDPKNDKAYFGKAEASLGIQEIDAEEIAADYEKAIELNGKEPLYYVRYGGFCMDEMRFKKAEECYNKAAELDEVNARHYYAEFANEYVFMENVRKELKGNRRKRVYKKALNYLLKGIQITADEAIEYLKELIEEENEREKE